MDDGRTMLNLAARSPGGHDATGPLPDGAETRALLSVALSLGSAMGPAEIARRVAREVTRLLGADTAIYLERIEEHDLYADAVAGYRVPAWLRSRDSRIDLVDVPPVFKDAVATRRAVWSADVPRDPRFDHPAFTSLERVPRSLLHHVVESNGRITGALVVYWWDAAHEMTPQELELVGALAQQAGLAIENARLYARAEARAAKLRALAELTGLINSASGPAVFHAIVEAAARLLGAQIAHVWVDDPEAGVLRSRAVYKAGTVARPAVLEMPRGCGIASDILKTGVPESIPDVRKDPRFFAVPGLNDGVRGFGGAPLKAGDRVVGVLVVLMERLHVLTTEERELLALLADHAAIAIERGRLFDELRVAYDDLQQTQTQLIQAEKLRALGEMAGGVAHDFNNLLAAILGRAQFMLVKLPSLPLPEMRRCLHVIEHAALDGAETVRRLQEFTRAAPRATDADLVSLTDIVAEAIGMAHARWRDAGGAADVRIDRDLPALPPLRGRAAELREVFLNVVTNALEAMPNGGALSVRGRTVGNEVVIEVADTGLGMAEDVRRRVFEPFFTTKGPQRSGLGLSVAFGVISRHEGLISVRSEPDRGSTFRMALPVVAGASPLTAGGSAATRDPSSLRVLVIDQDAVVRGALAATLRSLGHDVVEADDGAVGLGLIDTIALDLVCTALRLRGTTGWEVVEQVKARRPTIKCALVAEPGLPVVQSSLAARHIDALLSQPFHTNHVVTALAAVRAGAPAQREVEE